MIPTPDAILLPAFGFYAPAGSFIAGGRFSIPMEAKR